MNAIFTSGDVVLRVATANVPAVASIELAMFLERQGIAFRPPAVPTSSSMDR